MTKPPCKICDKRTVKCHTSCKVYIDWCAMHLREKENIAKIKSANNTHMEYCMVNVERYKKKLRD